MSDAIAQLLALRRMRERQAATAFETARRKHREQEAHVAALEQQQEALTVETRTRIESMYRSCIGTAMTGGDLERLTGAVDRLNIRMTETRVMVAGQRQHRDYLSDEAEKARQTRVQRERTVRKLEHLLEDLESEAARAAEVAAESELDGTAGVRPEGRDA